MTLSTMNPHLTPQHAVVDDAPLAPKLIKLLLTRECSEVFLWSEAATPCEMIRMRQPDLVMQDDCVAGSKVIDCLRADPAPSEIPVIIVSGTAETVRGEDGRLSTLVYARFVRPIDTCERSQLNAAALQHRVHGKTAWRTGARHTGRIYPPPRPDEAARRWLS